jgi:hypothetical protein
MGKLATAFRSLFTNRAVALSSIYEQIRAQLQATHPDSYPRDIYYEMGILFVVIGREGKLYKAPIIQADKSTFLVGEMIEVVEQFSERQTILRASQEHWLILCGTTVLNRSGEIDSTRLYDNFILRAETSQQYPYLTIYHLGRDFKIGETIFLARDENVYMAAGRWDQSELAQATKRSVESNPDYWGASNRFMALGKPDVVRAGDVEIPVYTDGIHIEISILPEKEAASLFTTTTSEEVIRMNEKIQKAILKIFEDDADKARKFIEQIDEVNRRIKDEGLIFREAKLDAPPAPVTEEPKPGPDTDDIIKKVLGILEERGYITREVFDPLQKTLDDIVADLTEVADLAESLRKTDEEKHRDWLAEMTDQTVKPDGHRPSTQPKPNDGASMSLAEIASATLEKIAAPKV